MKKLSLLVVIFIVNITLGQTTIPSTTTPSKFWEKVRFGGGFGVNFGNNATDVNLSPTLFYEVNEKVTLGVSMIGSYTEVKDNFSSIIYGASIIGLANVISSVQLSGEIEQLRMNTTLSNSDRKINDWNTALFLGAGYVTGNMTFGVRYNVLHNDNNNIYSQAWMPFFRVMF